MAWFAVPDGRSGRPLRFSDQAIEFCLTLKGVFQLPLRQVTGLVESLLKMAGLDWPTPDYTTLCRRQRTLSVDLGGRSSSDGLHLLVDSTGKDDGRRRVEDQEAWSVPPWPVAQGAYRD